MTDTPPDNIRPALRAALEAALPRQHHDAVDDVVALLIGLLDQTLPISEGAYALEAGARLRAAVSELARQRSQIAAAQTLISFSNTVVKGDVNIKNVAGGHVFDIALHLPARSAGDERAASNREKMLQKVRNMWVKGLLERSLPEELRIDLRLLSQPDAVYLPLNLQVQELQQPARALPPTTPIDAIFQEFSSELLILGAPGAGKTMLLVQLASALIDLAVLDHRRPIPVLLNLSSWSAGRPALDRWLVAEINRIYDVPRGLVAAWLAADALLLLLDGLDEVQPAAQGDCVAAINAFRQDHGMTQLAVCSRRADYDRLGQPLKLQGAVQILPLDDRQIAAYLDGLGQPLAHVRPMLEADAELHALARAPLMLGMIVATYHDPQVPPVRGDGDAQQQLFAAYFEQMLVRRGVHRQYRLERTRHWLAWLAAQMRQHGQSIFLIEGLQPDWLPSKMAQLTYHIGDRLSSVVVWFFAYVLGIPNLTEFAAITLMCMSFGGQHHVKSLSRRAFPKKLRDALIGAAYGFAIGVAIHSPQPIVGFDVMGKGFAEIIVFSLIGGIIGVSAGLPNYWPRRVLVFDDVKFSWVKAIHYSFIIGIIGFICSIPAAIVLTSMLWQSKESSYIFEYLEQLSIGSADSLYFIIATTVGLCLPAIMFGFLFGLIGFVSGIFVEDVIDTTTSPNQGIRRTLRGMAIAGAAAGITLSLLYAILGGAAFGIAFGILVGFIFGGYSCISHLCLRVLLWRQGALPWNYARFLDYADRLLVLRRVGGGYIFIHRALLEHLAAQGSPRGPAALGQPATPPATPDA